MRYVEKLEVEKETCECASCESNFKTISSYSYCQMVDCLTPFVLALDKSLQFTIRASNYTMCINVNKYVWDKTIYGYVASFDFEGKTFEVRVHTDEENHIKTCAIHEWLNPNDYIEGLDESNIYGEANGLTWEEIKDFD